MSKEREYEKLLWKNYTWATVSNSDNSTDSEGKLKMKPMGLISDRQTEMEKEPASKKRERQAKDTQINGKNSGGANGDNDGSGGVEVKKKKGILINSDNTYNNESDHEIHLWTERERRKKMKSLFINLHALLPQLPSKVDKSTIVDEAVSYIKTLEVTLQKLEKQKQEKLRGIATTFNYNPNPSSSTFAPLKLVDSREAFLADQGSSCPGNLAAIATTTTTKPSSSHTTVPNVLSKKQPVLFQTWTSPNVVLNVCGNEAQLNICSLKKSGIFTSICFILEKYHIEIMSAHVSSDGNRRSYMIQARPGSKGFGPFKEAIPVEEVYGKAAMEIMCCVSSCSCADMQKLQLV